MLLVSVIVLTEIIFGSNISASTPPIGSNWNGNPILSPMAGELLTAGTTFTILWTPIKGDLVSIELWNISVPISVLAQNISNTGTFQWAIPQGLPTSSNYFLDVYVPVLVGNYSYFTTGLFTI